MEIFYFKSNNGNFGDDLNPWLWPQLFKNLNHLEDAYFIGIGSILHAHNQDLIKIKDRNKIVFGTGLRPSNIYKPFRINNKWDIKFLRGPLSSKALGGNFRYISDAAYAVRNLDSFSKYSNVKKKYKISLMPYFHSVKYFDWQKICDELGFHYISPFSENGVDHTLEEISQSEFIITEAMHGAILADALRVPWHRFIFTTPYTEGERVSSFKWDDWLQSINLIASKVSFIQFYKKTFLHQKVNMLTNNRVHIQFFFKEKVKNELLKCLSDSKEFYLSDNEVVKDIDSKFAEEIYNLNKALV